MGGLGVRRKTTVPGLGVKEPRLYEVRNGKLVEVPIYLPLLKSLPPLNG